VLGGASTRVRVDTVIAGEQSEYGEGCLGTTPALTA